MKIQSAKAGIGTGRAGLQAASGLFSSAGLFQKGVKSFNPLDLDPYLLFDAETSMLGTLEAETLDLDPANLSSLDVITATRSSVATRTLPDGSIALAEQDTVRVDHTQGEQLTPTKFQHVVQTDYSASPNVIDVRGTLSDISGPDGESGGVRVTETANNTQHYLAVKTSEIVSGTTYTVSFYVKEGAYSSVRFYTQSAKVDSNVFIDFSTGNATFSGLDLVSNSGSFTSVGDGWYRVVYSATAHGSGEMDLYVSPKDLSSYAGDVNNFTDYYGFQVEEGTTATDFMANTTGSPKFITGATYGPRVPMILVEPSATNLVTHTDFSAGWTLSSSNKQETDISSPFESQNALRVTPSQTFGRIQDYIGSSSATTISVYVKRDATDSRVSINSDGYGAVYFNLTQAGVSYHSVDGSPAGYDIEEHGDGWWRISASFSSVDYFKLYPDLELGTRSVLFALPQVEAGSVATSYIPTSGSTVTRAADDLVISGSAFTDFYNQSEGTFYIEDIPRVVNSTQIARFSLNDGTNVTSMYSLVSGAYDLLVKANGSANSYNVGGTTIVPNQLERVAFSYITDEIKVSRDGALNNPANNPSTQAIPVVDRLHLGQIDGFTRNLNGRIRRIIYWPTHSDSL